MEPRDKYHIKPKDLVPDRHVWPSMIFGAGYETYTEKQFQAAVMKSIAPYFGFVRTMHIPYSAGMPKDWPDVTLIRVDVRAPEIVFFELKGPRTVPTPGQLLYLRDLRATGHHAYLAQPKDYEVVADILRNVYARPVPGSGWTEPEILRRLSMDQTTGERIR